MRFGHSVVQFGAAITRARERLAHERVWWGDPRCKHLPPNRASNCEPSVQVSALTAHSSRPRSTARRYQLRATPPTVAGPTPGG
jgi:hypothetical protein